MRATAPLTERQQREREYYEEFRKLHPVQSVNLKPILGEETRPWNEYWYVYQTIKDEFHSPTQKVLDFGCGPGDSSVLLAKIGYRVAGFDISSENVANARELAARYDCGDRIELSVQAAESLEYADASFDVVCGIDILHHIDVVKAVPEAWRVLKPGGLAVFKEWVEAPVFDFIRQSRFVLRLFPREASLENHITQDERKLTVEEVKLICGMFRLAQVERFHLTMRLCRVIGHSLYLVRKLSQLDRTIVRVLPAAQPLAGSAVFVLRK